MKLFGYEPKWQLESRAVGLVESIKLEIERANEASSFGSFVLWYEMALSNLKEGMEIENKAGHLKRISGSFKDDYYRLRDEMQWHMRDALEKEYDEIMNDYKGRYRNNKEKLLEHFNDYKQSIDMYSGRFDEETRSFSNGLLKKLSLKLDVPISNNNYADSETGMYPDDTYNFDTLEGLEFEFWCANLLRKNGFSNVEVTQGSGDQGVDIVAEKDDIRYAIQCKCYSTDLGNTPIQEVCAGKAFYKCQIGVVMTNRYFTQSAQELAMATGTLLWDRTRLLKMLNHQV